MAKSKKRPERVSGGYFAMPWSVMDSSAFTGASDKAKAIILAIGRQLSGDNNGHLQAAKTWLAQQGFTSPAVNKNSIAELVDRGLLVKTKQGGLNLGPDLYAVTWLPITNYFGLEIGPRDFRQGGYQLCNLPKTKRRPQPKQKNRSSASEPVLVRCVNQ